MRSFGPFGQKSVRKTGLLSRSGTRLPLDLNAVRQWVSYAERTPHPTPNSCRDRRSPHDNLFARRTSALGVGETGRREKRRTYVKNGLQSKWVYSKQNNLKASRLGGRQSARGDVPVTSPRRTSVSQDGTIASPVLNCLIPKPLATGYPYLCGS